ncbi:hypothetical protein HRI_002341300 [Hibiscus trionum]|uniref:RING-type E3 ubiquitin transferase n=1 Tax=Hibiscus trionum TaxID=183268 RepID=A0A9W7M3N4_HIBTR|nr:hypothetical protein HRI_002341300 [Hibiscus trionum]
MSSDSTHFIYNGFTHCVSLIIIEIHHVPLPLIQIHLTISVANNFRLFDRPKPSFTVFDQETLVFDLNLLRHRNQLHRLLVLTFTNLGGEHRHYSLRQDGEQNNPTGTGDCEMDGELRIQLQSVVFRFDNYGMVPTRESSVKEMGRTVKVEDGEGDCTLCLEGFEVRPNVAQMPCSHMFHSECIEEWLKQSHYCPVCRFEMPC